MRSTYLPSIVLIDDDEDDREMLSSALQLQGCTVRTFDAGTRAIEALKLVKNPQDLPSLIILDYNMPGMNGEQVLIFLKGEQHIKDVPVVVYSTCLSSVCRKTLVKFGAHSGMVKSWTSEEFTAQVLHFKAIALSQRKGRQISPPRTSFKFFSRLSSSKVSHQNFA